MKLKPIDKIVDQSSTINFCCAEIMASVVELNDKQYNQLFKALCKILKKSPKEMTEAVRVNNFSGSPRAK